jgi:hypothetical protein
MFNIRNYSSILLSKYQSVNNLFNKMCSELVDERPNCDKILQVPNKNSWALNAVELVNYGGEIKKIDEISFGTDSYVTTFMCMRMMEELEKISSYTLLL